MIASELGTCIRGALLTQIAIVMMQVVIVMKQVAIVAFAWHRFVRDQLARNQSVRICGRHGVFLAN